MGDHYQVLGLKPDATKKEISKAYRALARKLHPDKQRPGASEAEKQKAKAAFQQLSEAHEILSDDAKRQHYDITMCSAGPAGSSAGASAGAGGGDGGGGEGPDLRAPDVGRREGDWDWRWSTPADLERRRREREEHEEILRNRFKERDQGLGIGGHWVKPGSAGQQKAGGGAAWNGWTKDGATPAKKTTVAESDTSSELSFDVGINSCGPHVGINLNDLNLDDAVPVDGENWGGGEVWKRGPDTKASAGHSGATGTKSPGSVDPKKLQPACCRLQ